MKRKCAEEYSTGKKRASKLKNDDGNGPNNRYGNYFVTPRKHTSLGLTFFWLRNYVMSHFVPDLAAFISSVRILTRSSISFLVRAQFEFSATI